MDDKYKSLDILKLTDMYFLEIAKFMNKSYYRALPLSFEEYYSFIDHSHNTQAKSTEALYLRQIPELNLGKAPSNLQGLKSGTNLPIL